jgi:hypothetical protein
VSALDAKIDDLYKQPLGDFISSRNALAKSLSGEEAKRVRALAKPTVVPWAVNQVYWNARGAYDRLMKTGEQLRKAQIAALEGKAVDLRAAGDAHRRAVADAVGEAERLAAGAGSKPGPDALMRTFEALSVAGGPPEQPGRLTQPLQPAGFEALAGVKPGAVAGGPERTAPQRKDEPAGPTFAGPKRVAPRGHEASAPTAREREQTKKEKEREAREAREREQAARAARAREAEVSKAAARLARVEAAEQQARAAWERAHDELLEARRALSAMKLVK